MPNNSTLDSVDLFTMIEQDVGILDITNNLIETVSIETIDLFSDTPESLNSMLTILGDPGDSINLNIEEWNEVGNTDGFIEYASVKDVTVTLQIEDDLTVV